MMVANLRFLYVDVVLFNDGHDRRLTTKEPMSALAVHHLLVPRCTSFPPTGSSVCPSTGLASPSPSKRGQATVASARWSSGTEEAIRAAGVDVPIAGWGHGLGMEGGR